MLGAASGAGMTGAVRPWKSNGKASKMQATGDPRTRAQHASRKGGEKPRGKKQTRVHGNDWCMQRGRKHVRSARSPRGCGYRHIKPPALRPRTAGRRACTARSERSPMLGRTRLAWTNLFHKSGVLQSRREQASALSAAAALPAQRSASRERPAPEGKGPRAARRAIGHALSPRGRARAWSVAALPRH